MSIRISRVIMTVLLSWLLFAATGVQAQTPIKSQPAAKPVRWKICEVQVKTIVCQFFKTTMGKDCDTTKSDIVVTAKPAKDGYTLLALECGSLKADEKMLHDTMLQGAWELLAQPLTKDGKEKYCHSMMK